MFNEIYLFSVQKCVEKGIWIQMLRFIENFRSDTKTDRLGNVYTSLNTYIKDHTEFTSIKLNYFLYILIFIFTIQIIVLVIFFINKIFELILKSHSSK